MTEEDTRTFLRNAYLLENKSLCKNNGTVTIVN